MTESAPAPTKCPVSEATFQATFDALLATSQDGKTIQASLLSDETLLTALVICEALASNALAAPAPVAATFALLYDALSLEMETR